MGIIKKLTVKKVLTVQEKKQLKVIKKKLKTLRPKLDTKKVQIEKAKISYHHAKKVVVHKMKLLKVATKMKIKVDASVTKAIEQTSSVIKKAVVVNKATIKISTKI